MLAWKTWPAAPVPLIVRASAPTVMVLALCNCSVAPLATVVPLAVVPSAVSFWMFRMPWVTLVRPP